MQREREVGSKQKRGHCKGPKTGMILLVHARRAGRRPAWERVKPRGEPGLAGKDLGKEFRFYFKYNEKPLHVLSGRLTSSL